MNDWYKWVFSGVGVVFITALITFLKTKGMYFTGIRFLERSEVDHALGTIQERFENVTTEVRISGNDLKFVAESSSTLIGDLLKRGIHVKLLGVDPNSMAPDRGNWGQEIGVKQEIVKGNWGQIFPLDNLRK